MQLNGHEPGGEATTVLVVEDDASLRLLCRLNLELERYSVLEAGTLDVAEEILTQEPSTSCSSTCMSRAVTGPSFCP